MKKRISPLQLVGIMNRFNTTDFPEYLFQFPHEYLFQMFDISKINIFRRKSLKNNYGTLMIFLWWKALLEIHPYEAKRVIDEYRKVLRMAYPESSKIWSGVLRSIEIDIGNYLSLSFLDVSKYFVNKVLESKDPKNMLYTVKFSFFIEELYSNTIIPTLEKYEIVED